VSRSQDSLADSERCDVHVPLSETERIELKKCAERCGLSLVEWMRDRLLLAAKREAKDA
jgi:hypothetical protein